MSSIRSEPIATSDTESVDGEDEALLSPSDGFFSQASVPEEMLVPDPDQRDTQADKEREAREEQTVQASGSQTIEPTQAPLHSPVRQVSHTPSHSFHSVVNEDDERTPLISYAPPAYSDIARDTNTQPSTSGYNTMGNEAALFPSGNPQDLGGSDQEPLLGGERPQRRSWRAYLTDGNKVGKLLVIICFVLLGVGFIGSVVRYKNNWHPHKMPAGAHVRPVPASCRHATYKSRDEFAFTDPSSFSFVQKKVEFTGDRRWRGHVQVSGQVLVRKTDASEVKVDVEYRTNTQALFDDLSLRPSEDDAVYDSSLELWVPQYVDDRLTRETPCLDIDVVVSVPFNTSFQLVHVSVETLDIIFSDPAYSASDTSVATRVGSVASNDASVIDSRSIHIHVGTGSVQGSYPLLDLLDIVTRTGSVDVSVIPKPADRHNLPAELRIDTNTGSVRVRAMDRLSWPVRDYRTIIRSRTSSITADPLPHGSSTELHGRTSSIYGVLYPVGPLDEASTIHAETNTGSLEMAVAPHAQHPTEPMRHLNGRYTSHTGRVQLTHPMQWEGHVDAYSSTGSVKIDWPGLSGKQEDYDGLFPGLLYPGSSFRGDKGKGDGQLEAHSNTGSVDLNGRDI